MAYGGHFSAFWIILMAVAGPLFRFSQYDGVQCQTFKIGASFSRVWLFECGACFSA